MTEMNTEPLRAQLADDPLTAPAAPASPLLAVAQSVGPRESAADLAMPMAVAPMSSWAELVSGLGMYALGTDNAGVSSDDVWMRFTVYLHRSRRERARQFGRGATHARAHGLHADTKPG